LTIPGDSHSRPPYSSPANAGNKDRRLSRGIWTATGSLGTARHSHTATLLPNGTVPVAGGDNRQIGYLDSAELYDPATGTWAATGSLNTARDEHTATLLPNGKVLVAAGFGSGLSALASAELYD
jgi:hypothetical protein